MGKALRKAGFVGSSGRVGQPLQPKLGNGLNEKGDLKGDEAVVSFRLAYGSIAVELLVEATSTGVWGLTSEPTVDDEDGGEEADFSLGVLAACGDAEADLRLEFRLLDLRSSESV